MREFSPFEKNAMRIIARNNPAGTSVQNFATVIGNLFAGLDVGIDINPIGNQMTITYSGNASMKEFLLINDITDKLISLQILFEYLEQLSLIRLYNNGVNGESLEIKKHKAITINKEISDETINSYYCTHWTYFFCVTEAFRNYVLINEFKTDEQIRFEKQLKEAKRQTCGAYIAAGVSFLGLLVALILPFCIETKLAEIEDIKQEIKAVKTEIPSVIDTRITNDTLKVDVLKPNIVPKTK